jgi:type IV pilus assembly protein PilC
MRPSRDLRLLCFVMNRLAMAVGHGLPLAPTLRALAQEPDLTGAGIRRPAWRQRLGLVVGDLEAGRTLSEAFERHLKAYLPPHFVPALRCAEQADCVGRVLPLLAANLVAATKAQHRWRGALAYPLMLFAVMASIVSGLFIFIMPKFLKMFDEMAPGHYSPYTAFLGTLAHIIGQVIPSLLFVLAVLACLNVLRRILWRRAAVGRRIAEAVGEHLPVARGFLRRRGLAESAGALAAFLATGADVTKAARWAAESVETRWARRRLRQFADALAAGIPCADAWSALAVRSPLSDWMVCNAVARERPAEGFQAVAELALDELSRHYRRFFVWLEPALVLGNALIVGSVVYALLGSLFGTVYAILNI